MFTDEFHLYSLRPFLSATGQSHPKVDIKLIGITFVDRLAANAAREAVRRFRGIPEDAQLFEVLETSRRTHQGAYNGTCTMERRPDGVVTGWTSIQDITAFLVSLTDLSLSAVTQTDSNT